MKKCSICGKPVFGAVEVCPDCLKRAGIDPGQIRKIKQINSILSITAGTDGNIKECVQSLAEILEGLERGSHGKEEEQGNAIQAGNKDNL